MSVAHQIEVLTIKGEGGTVHVRTADNLETEIVDDQITGLDAHLGETALKTLDYPEPLERTKAVDSFFVKTRRGAEKPSKLQK